MKTNRYLFILCLMLTAIVLNGVLTEYSASANALSGVTLLSQSVGDYALSPVIARTGICASWYKPFGVKDISYYGLHYAVPVRPVIIHTGINYLAHPDYRWQDEYLGVCLASGGFALGATQHLGYERIGDESWYKWDTDVAMNFSDRGYGAELRYLRCFSDDAALTLSVMTSLTPSATACTAYTWHKHEKGYYAAATSYQLANPLILQSSWQSDPARFGIGLKFLVGKLELMYALRTHPELDLTHCVDLGAKW